jgi:nucleotide-binding universal stress UspA family protein
MASSDQSTPEMEYPQIKRVGVGLPGTPQSDAVFAEASRFAARLNASLTLIHAEVTKAEHKSPGIAHEKHVGNQTDPSKAVLEAVVQNRIDLLVMGAFDGPAVGRRRFLGPLARKIAESAKCSLLLVAHPRIEKHDFRRIVAITDFSESSKVACSQAIWLAGNDSAEAIHITSIHTIFMDARAGMGVMDGKPARTLAEEEELLENFVSSLPPSEVPLEWRVIDATTGFAACDFAEAMEADLLVLPAHNRPGGRVPPMADWALQVVPCSLWIVHCPTTPA